MAVEFLSLRWFSAGTVRREGKGMKRVYTVMRRRALLMAASCLIWLRMAVLGSEEEEEEEKLERSIFQTDVGLQGRGTEGWEGREFLGRPGPGLREFFWLQKLFLTSTMDNLF